MPNSITTNPAGVIGLILQRETQLFTPEQGNLSFGIGSLIAPPTLICRLTFLRLARLNKRILIKIGDIN